MSFKLMKALAGVGGCGKRCVFARSPSIPLGHTATLCSVRVTAQLVEAIRPALVFQTPVKNKFHMVQATAKRARACVSPSEV